MSVMITEEVCMRMQEQEQAYRGLVWSGGGAKGALDTARWFKNIPQPQTLPLPSNIDSVYSIFNTLLPPDL